MPPTRSRSHLTKVYVHFFLCHGMFSLLLNNFQLFIRLIPLLNVKIMSTKTPSDDIRKKFWRTWKFSPKREIAMIVVSMTWMHKKEAAHKTGNFIANRICIGLILFLWYMADHKLSAFCSFSASALFACSQK